MPNIECPGCKIVFNEFSTKNHDYLNKGAVLICHNQNPPKKYLRKDAATIQYTLDQIPHVINDLAAQVIDTYDKVKQVSEDSQEVTKIMKAAVLEIAKIKSRVKEVENVQITIEKKIDIIARHLVSSTYSSIDCISQADRDILFDKGNEKEESSTQ